MLSRRVCGWATQTASKPLWPRWTTRSGIRGPGITSLWPPGRRWRSAGGDVLPAPFIADSAPPGALVWLMEELLLEAVARDALGDQAAAGRAIERAVDLAEPDHMLYPRAHRCLRCCPRERRNHQPSLVKHPLLTRGRSRGYQLSPASTRPRFTTMTPPVTCDPDQPLHASGSVIHTPSSSGSVLKHNSPMRPAAMPHLPEQWCVLCADVAVWAEGWDELHERRGWFGVSKAAR